MAGTLKPSPGRAERIHCARAPSAFSPSAPACAPRCGDAPVRLRNDASRSAASSSPCLMAFARSWSLDASAIMASNLACSSPDRSRSSATPDWASSCACVMSAARRSMSLSAMLDMARFPFPWDWWIPCVIPRWVSPWREGFCVRGRTVGGFRPGDVRRVGGSERGVRVEREDSSERGRGGPLLRRRGAAIGPLEEADELVLPPRASRTSSRSASKCFASDRTATEVSSYAGVFTDATSMSWPLMRDRSGKPWSLRPQSSSNAMNANDDCRTSPRCTSS